MTALQATRRSRARVAIAAGAVCWAATSAMAACPLPIEPDGLPRFEVAGAEAVDRRTGLVWRRCSLGLAYVDGRCEGERSYLTYPDAEEAALSVGAPWRLPELRELGGLMDPDCAAPAVSAEVFPDVSPATGEGENLYWTGTDAGFAGMKYYVDFAGGFADIRSPGFSMHVRLVRRGSP